MTPGRLGCALLRIESVRNRVGDDARRELGGVAVDLERGFHSFHSFHSDSSSRKGPNPCAPASSLIVRSAVYLERHVRRAAAILVRCRAQAERLLAPQSPRAPQFARRGVARARAADELERDVDIPECLAHRCHGAWAVAWRSQRSATARSSTSDGGDACDYALRVSTLCSPLARGAVHLSVDRGWFRDNRDATQYYRPANPIQSVGGSGTHPPPLLVSSGFVGGVKTAVALVPILTSGVPHPAVRRLLTATRSPG